MQYHDSIIDLIGRTPLVKIKKSPDGEVTDCLILAKLEYMNPGGSVKDRIAMSMIEDAEKRGLISPNKTVIIEPTSGNTGIGLAMICAAKGYKLILVMPESMSLERRTLFVAYGAEIILTSASMGMKGAVECSNKIAKNIADSFVPQQFNNPANPDIHYKTTALEIWDDTGGEIDILITGVGTGGTITGISKFIKEKKKDFMAIAVEPEESPVLSGGAAGSHKIQGIGAGFIPENLDMNYVDKIETVSSNNAIEIARFMAHSQGLMIGISSGAVLSVAFQYASNPAYKHKNIVVIIPSNGERYLSSVLYSDIQEKVKKLVISPI